MHEEPEIALYASEYAGSFINEVRETFLDLIDAGEPFTAEDVRNDLSQEAKHWLNAHPNSLGSLFMVYRAQRYIEPVGWGKPKRKSRHGNFIRIWVATPARRAL